MAGIATNGAEHLLRKEGLWPFAEHMRTELAADGELDMRTLSLLARGDGRKERFCKNLVRRLTGEVIPVDEAGQDAAPLAGVAWRALILKVDRVQSIAHEYHKEQAAADRAIAGGTETVAGRDMTDDQYKLLTDRWKASAASGGRLAAEPFLPDVRTASAWRKAFTRNKAEGECETLEWYSLDELPLEQVGALKGVHCRPTKGGKNSTPTGAYEIYERHELSLEAAEWTSLGRPAPTGYDCGGDATREIFSHEARQLASEELRVLLSAAQRLDATRAARAMLAACRRFGQDMRSGVVKGVVPSLVVATCLPTIRAQIVDIDREAEESGGDGGAVKAAGADAAPSPAALTSLLTQAIAGAVASVGSASPGGAAKRAKTAGQATPVNAPGPNLARNQKRRAAKRGATAAGDAPQAGAVKALLAALGGAAAPAPAPAPAPAATKASGGVDALLALLQGKAPATPGKAKCYDFSVGRCTRGAACRFSHDP